jgi:hypothetical protein
VAPGNRQGVKRNNVLEFTQMKERKHILDKKTGYRGKLSQATASWTD